MKTDREKFTILLLILFFLPFSFLNSQTEEASRIFDQNKAGVISLIIYGEDKEEISHGTGFIVNQGIIATGYHLVSQAVSVEGKDFKGKKVKVEGILGYDKNLDVAFLKIKGKTPALTLGNSSELEMGKRIFALGSNESKEITVSEGTVRDFLNLTATQRVVDTSLAIPETFNGAPLLDINGQVLGAIIFLDQRSRFVLPINQLKSLPKKKALTKFKDWKQEDYFSTFEGAYLAGRIFALLDETGKAQRYLREVVKTKPEDIQAHSILATIYTKQRNYESAISSYEKVIELDENRDDAHYGLGLVYFRMQRYSDAIPSLEKAIQINLDNQKAYLQIGNAYEQLKNFSKAADAYEKYLNTEPENAWTAHLRVGLCKTELGQLEEAIAAFQEALKEKPRDVKINYHLGQAYQKASQYEKAEEVYKMLAEISPDEAMTYYRTILKMYDDAGNHDKAVDAAKMIVEYDPNNADAIYNLGYMYVRLEKYDEAIETFKKALEIRPNFEFAYSNLGYCYSKQKKYKESIEAFTKFVELSPDNADGWFNIGIGYMQLKKFDSALEPLQKTVELRPDYGVAYYNLAITYLNLHDNYSARDVYKKLTTLDPNLAQKLKKYLR